MENEFQSYNEEFKELVKETVSKNFDLYVQQEFDGSIIAFVNRFIAVNSDMFSDIVTYNERFAESFSSNTYSVYLVNVYLGENFRPIFHLFFRMMYTESFPDEIGEYSKDYHIAYDLFRDETGSWSIYENPDHDADLYQGECGISRKDFFLIKKRLTEPLIF